MQLTHLNLYVQLIDEIILTLQPSRIRQLEWIRYDLDTICRNQIAAGMPNSLKPAWYRTIYDRLNFIDAPTRVSATFNRLKGEVRAASSGVSLRLHFGQMRIAPQFQTMNAGQLLTPGFPANMANSDLTTISTRLQNGEYLPDQIPVKIFNHNNRWVVANNRGYTAHCKAGTRPLRLWPLAPSQLEVNRLAEVEGQGQIQIFTNPRAPAVGVRTLPSIYMFVTQGPNSYALQEVVTSPATWV